MNGWIVIIIGLILVGAGGFLGFYGAALTNRADNETASNTLNAKISEVLARLDTAERNAPPTGQTSPTQRTPSAQSPTAATDRTREIASITRDFKAWASQFV